MLGGVIVAELGCAAVTPWRAVHITGVWRGYVGALDYGVLGGKDGLELVAVSWGGGMVLGWLLRRWIVCAV